MAELSPISARERLAAVDVIRGWALLGVLIANIHVDLGGLRHRPAESPEVKRPAVVDLKPSEHARDLEQKCQSIFWP